MKKLVSFGLILLVTVLLTEVAIRLFFPQYAPHPGFTRRTEYAGLILGQENQTIRHVKNTGDYDVLVTMNEFGFRDSKALTDADPDDWFVLGDSFAFGWGVKEQQRFDYLLSQKIDSNVYNLGVPGTNLINYARVLGYLASKNIDPEHVILALCMENDIAQYQSIRKNLEHLRQNPREDPPLKTRITNELKALKRYSALINAFTFVAHQNQWLYEGFVKLGLIRPNLQGIPSHRYNQKAIEQTVGEIERIAAGRNLLVLIIPSRRLWIQQTQDSHKIHAQLLVSLRKQGLPFIDLRPDFESAGASALSYHFKNDGHWNPAGHRRAADALIKALELE